MRDEDVRHLLEHGGLLFCEMVRQGAGFVNGHGLDDLFCEFLGGHAGTPVLLHKKHHRGKAHTSRKRCDHGLL